MSRIRPLPEVLWPREVAITLAIQPDVVEEVSEELHEWARSDANRCFGYFPGMNGTEGIRQDLPACRKVRAAAAQAFR